MNPGVDDLTQIAAAFVATTYKVVRDNKPEATPFEIEGLAFRILVNALDNFKLHEQQTESSLGESSEGTLGESEQVQGSGGAGGSSEDTQGVLSEQGSLTKGGKKKRRSKKS